MIIETLERRRLLALFGFDVSFGDGGSAGVSAHSVLEILPDGKLLTIGNRLLDLSGHDAQPVLLVSRLNADGTIDTSFGEGGRLNFGNAVHAAYVAPRFYVVDFSSSGPDVLEAYTHDGVLDPTFSGDGREPVTTFARPVNGAVDPSPRVVSIDSTPDGDLLIISDLAARRRPNEDLVRAKIITRVDAATGAIDRTFDEDGYLVFAETDQDFVVTNQGILGASQTNGGTLTRYGFDGTVDTAFGDAGRVTFNFVLGHIVAQEDGKVILATSSSSEEDDRMIRLNVDGSPDTTFGTGGTVRLRDANDEPLRVNSVFLDEQQRVYVDVLSADSLRRYTPAGVLEAAPFDGSLRVPEGGAFTAHRVAVDSTGRLVFASHDVTRLHDLSPVQLGRNNVLYVHGDGAGDDVTVAPPSGGNIAIELNGQTTTSSAAGVVGLGLRLADGANRVDASAVALPVTVNTHLGDDSVITGAGDDRLTGSDGSDTMNAGAGDDTIFTFGGDKLIDVGDGDDSIDLSDLGARYTITGGDGNKDIRYLTSADGNTITLGTGGSRVVAAGSSSGDRVTIEGGSNRVAMSWDATVEIGGNGNNEVDVSFGNGVTQVTTGDGNDTIRAGGGLGTGTVRTNGGDDVIEITMAGDQRPRTFFMGDGNDRVRFTRDSMATVHGGNGDDLFVGAGAAERFIGDAGNDTILAGDGDNTIYGGAGDDSIKSGAGLDHIFADEGDDTVKAGLGNDRVSGGAGRDRLFGQQGNDRLSGTNHSDALDGGPGRDTLLGLSGNDKLFDTSGNDVLDGGPDSDVLFAEDGDRDTLHGGDGIDQGDADNMLDDIDGLETVR